MDSDGNSGAFRKQDPRLLRAVNGDQEALGSLLVSFMPQLYRTALRFLGMPQEAEEAVQDGLVQVVKHFRRFEGRSHFSTWVTRIIINSALMRLRRNHPAIVISIDERPPLDELPRAGRIPDPAPNPEELYARKEQIQLIGRKLRGLPAGYRSVLWLRDVQGFSTKKAAEILGIKTATLKSQLLRARRRLRKEICKARPKDRALRTDPTRRTGRRRLMARAMSGTGELAV